MSFVYELVLCYTFSYSAKPGWIFMRRMAAFLFGPLVLLGLLLLLVLETPLAADELAIPRPQAARAVITSPESRAALRGRVPISGTALHPDFQRYELYYKLEPGDNWIFIGEAHRAQVDDGLLGTWDTNSLTDGTYSLRLRVVRLDGNYEEAVVRQVLVANTQPTETPTPEVSPTPTDTPTPLPPTPTVIVEQPVIPTPTSRPTATPAPVEGDAAAQPGEDELGGLFGLNPLIGQINLTEIGDAFLLGIRYTLLAFAALGAYFILKRLLAWLWARIRG
jgi:hypothetical protein